MPARSRLNRASAALFCANNVFAHIDNMSDVVTGIRLLLSDNGVFVFEVSYIVDMIDNMVFDTIYHEHVSHHALIPLETFLNNHDMTLFHVARTATKGGSIRAFAQAKSTGQRPRSAELSALLAEEERRHITKPKIYQDWFAAIESRKRRVPRLSRQGDRRRQDGEKRPRPPCFITSELETRVKFIVDDNPLKQGRFSPGAHVPVLPSSELAAENPILS